MRFLLTAIILICSIRAFSQNFIDGIVLDAGTLKPIPYAHVILSDSSDGTFSDFDGNFQLKLNNASSKIIVSHVSYERVVTNVTPANSLRIKLNSLENKLDEIKVSTEIDTKWRKEYKIFERELFGQNPLSSHCKILNPWVIDFVKLRGAFMATSDDILEVSNEALGYIIQFRLDQFIKKGEMVSLKGEPIHIKDLSKESENLKAFNKRRNEAYSGSLAHFLKALSTGDLAQNGFQAYLIGSELLDVRGQSNKKLQESRIDSLSDITAVDEAMTIDFDGYIQVIYKDFINDKIEISWLKCKRPFVFDDKRFMLTNGDLIQYGVFATERLSHYPSQNKPNSNAISAIRFNEIQEKITDQVKTQNLVKVHVHLDREIYFPGEIIWFKSYLLNQKQSKPQKLFLELVSNDTSIIKAIYPLKNGTSHGNIEIPKNLPEGDYTVVSYLENGISTHHKKPIRIGKNKRVDVDTKKVLIEVFPEGGELIANVKNKVGFKISTDDGKPIDGEFDLIMNDSINVLKVETRWSGRGVFTFIPDTNAEYKIRSKNYQVLSENLRAGKGSVGISVNAKDYSLEALLSSNVDYKDSLYVAFSYRDSLVDFKPVFLRKSELIEISMNRLKDGINSLSILDANMNLLLHRFIFKMPTTRADIQIGLDSVYRTMDQTTIIIGGQDNIESASLSVIDLDQTHETGTENIMVTRYLRPELKGTIYDAETLFVEADKDKFDLLMLTNKRDDFLTVPGEKLAEKSGFTVSGRVHSSKIKKLRNEFVYVISKDGTQPLHYGVIDKEGDFLIENISFTDSTDLIFSLNKNLLKKVDSLTAMVDHSWSYEGGIESKYFHDLDEQINESLKLRTLLDSINKPLNAVLLDEVIVRTSRTNSSNKKRPYNQSSARVLEFYDNPIKGSGSKVLATIETGFSAVAVQVDYAGGPIPVDVKLVNRKNMNRSANNVVDFYLDNVPNEPVTLLHMNPAEIESIEYIDTHGPNGSLFVFTREQLLNNDRKKLFIKKLKGYYEGFDFENYQTIKASSGYNYGPLIHWNPTVDSQTHQIRFVNNAYPGTIKVVLEGLTTNGIPFRRSKSYVLNN